MSYALPQVLICEQEIEAKVNDLALQISRDYRDVDDLMLVGVLKGSFIFLADLARRLDVAHIVDFIAVSTYANVTTTDGAVRMILDLRSSIAGKHVLLIEDIVDSGYTMAYLVETLRAREPASLKTCVLIHKPTCTKMPAQIDYLGFELPDRWLVGYGLDWAEKYRTLPYIGVLDSAEKD